MSTAVKPDERTSTDDKISKPHPFCRVCLRSPAIKVGEPAVFVSECGEESVSASQFRGFCTKCLQVKYCPQCGSHLDHG